MASDPHDNTKDENPITKALHHVEDATGGRARRQPAGDQKQGNFEAIESAENAERG